MGALTEKMITIGKKNTLAARRQALAFITKEDVVKKLFDKIAPEFADKNGGYVQIYKLGPRRGDGAEMALIKLTLEEKAEEKTEEKSAKKKSSKKTAKKAEKKTEEKVEEKTEETAEEKAE